MKAKLVKYQVPVWNNVVWNPLSTATPPNRPPDKHIDAVEYRCPNCDSILSRDVTNETKLYCWNEKLYGIDYP